MNGLMRMKAGSEIVFNRAGRHADSHNRGIVCIGVDAWILKSPEN